MTGLPSLLYSDLETDLRASLRALLSDRSPIDQVLARIDLDEFFTKGSQATWSGLVEDLGVLALPVAEDVGGGGATWREVAVVMEELARGVLDVPYFSTAVLAVSLAQAVGAGPELALLASGDAIATVVAPITSTLVPHDDLVLSGSTLSGVVPSVVGALESTHLLVPVQDALVMVEAGAARVTPVASLDMTRRVADVAFERAPARAVADGPSVAEALRRTSDIGAAMLGSEQLGLAERTLELTVDYVGQRRQFGRTIGSYQAVKHRLADLWTSVTQARAVARYAAASASAPAESGAADLPVAASLAQAVCGSVALRMAEECVQLHGGIGFTWEHPAHLFLKRARADALILGTPSWHRQRLARLTNVPDPLAEPTLCPAPVKEG